MRFQDWQYQARVAALVRSGIISAAVGLVQPHRVTVTFAGLAPAAESASQTIQIQGDAAFIWFATCAFQAATATGVGLDPLQGAYLVRVVIPSGRSFARHTRRAAEGAGDWIPLSALAGPAARPAFWPFPVLLRAREAVTLQAFNGASVDRHVRLTLIGAKILTVGGAGA